MTRARRAPGRPQVAKPNKYPACAEVHEMYFQCALVTEAGFGKFINRCAQLNEKLDECNVREQVWAARHTSPRLTLYGRPARSGARYIGGRVTGGCHARRVICSSCIASRDICLYFAGVTRSA